MGNDFRFVFDRILENIILQLIFHIVALIRKIEGGAFGLLVMFQLAISKFCS